MSHQTAFDLMVGGFSGMFVSILALVALWVTGRKSPTGEGDNSPITERQANEAIHT
jgi:hypothetical protein